MKIQTLTERLSKLTDPRRQYGNIRHKLEDIIAIGLCTFVCGGEDFVDMEDFGKEREEFLRKYLELPNGIPDSDTFRRVFENINPEELSECLVNWLDAELPVRCVIAVDGATKYCVATYADGAYTVLNKTLKTTTYTITGLTNGTEYKFLVQAYVNGKWSAISTTYLVAATPNA